MHNLLKNLKLEKHSMLRSRTILKILKMKAGEKKARAKAKLIPAGRKLKNWQSKRQRRFYQRKKGKRDGSG